MLNTNDLTQSMNVYAKQLNRAYQTGSFPPLSAIISARTRYHWQSPDVDTLKIPNQLTGVSSCGVERGEARFELNLIPELRSKSQIFTGLSLSG
jgi:Leu/Phe-tRNA-protein transferase